MIKIARQLPLPVPLEACETYFLQNNYVLQRMIEGETYLLGGDEWVPAELLTAWDELYRNFPPNTILEGTTAPQFSKGVLKFGVYDCLMYDGELLFDVPWKDRLQKIDLLRTTIGAALSLQAYIVSEDFKREYQKQLWSEGASGFYLKDVQASYTPNEINPGVVEVKREP